ncbi:MAG: class I adenylate-forming enzyme family protein [Bacillota bacterium]|nr:class I adenylate-forming enzyme family protein [Bacillota bacterium]
MSRSTIWACPAPTRAARAKGVPGEMRDSDQVTVREMLHRAGRWFPKHEAAVDEGSRYTYADLLDAARRCANLYHRLGARKGDRIALMLYPSAIHTVALFGAFELGALPVALHVRESAETLARVVRRLVPTVLVYDAALEEAVARLLQLGSPVRGILRATSTAPGPERSLLAPEAEIPRDLAGASADFEPMPVYEQDPVAIVLSSGTTGVPKGIIHTNRTFMESARGGVYFWNGIKPSDSILNSMSTSFIGWYNLSLPFFNVGAKNVFLPKWDPRKFIEMVERERVTHAFLVPTMWRMLFKEGIEGRDLSSVKMAGFAGEIMDPTTLRRIRERVTPHVINIYGTTETGSCSGGTILFEEDMGEERLTSVGKPLLNADIRVIRPGGTAADELPPGESGEVIIRGPSVAAHVWDDPAAARRIFEEPGPWWHSGDMGHLDQEGYLYLEGRIDDMIISGGINIFPARVEDVLLAHPQVAECAVVGIPDPVWGQRVMAVVVPRQPGLTSEELDRFMRESELSDYQRPRIYEFVTELPRTGTGKIDRRSLRAQYAARTAAGERQGEAS